LHRTATFLIVTGAITEVDIVFGVTVVTKGRELDVVVVAAIGEVGVSIVNEIA
jgi:hypothetical protein